MAVTVRWYDVEKRIIVWEFAEAFSLAEFQTATNESFSLAEEIDHTHCVIFDLRRNVHLPGGAMVHMRSAQQRAVASPKYLFTVSVGGSRLGALLVKTLERIGFATYFTQYVYFEDTFEGALALIQAKLGMATITPLDSAAEG